MPIRLELAPANMKHCKLLLRDIRKEDLEEIKASRNCSARVALRDALKVSHVAYVAYFYGRIAAIFGVVKATSKTEGDFGIPWTITTNVVDAHPRVAWELSKAVINVMKKDYGMLANMVDARHTVALGWLKHLGFVIEDPVQHGPLGMMFCRATLGRRSHV